MHRNEAPLEGRPSRTTSQVQPQRKPIPYLRLVVDAPQATCPKCAHAFHGSACARCGLTARHLETYVATRAVTAPAALLDAWREVRLAWQDASGHDRLLRLARDHAEHAWLAMRYREVARGNDPIARECLVRVQRSAELALVVASMRGAAEPAAPYQATRRLLWMLLGSLALGWLLMKIVAGAH